MWFIYLFEVFHCELCLTNPITFYNKMTVHVREQSMLFTVIVAKISIVSYNIMASKLRINGLVEWTECGGEYDWTMILGG